MKHKTAVFFDKMILKPIFFACVIGVIFGIFSKSGTWKHILISIVGIIVTAGIGQSLYPNATSSDLASGRAWDKNDPDSVE